MLAPAVEVERLKDALNQDARRAVTAIHTLPGIWKKLDARYWNKGMIADGIKRKLKNIHPCGKNEHEKMVDLGDKVDELVSQLVELKHETALKYDKEFRGSIYRAMPKCYQEGWTRFALDEYEDEWTGFAVYLEQAHNQASRAKMEVASIAPEPGSAYGSQSKKWRCLNCNQDGHLSKDCPKTKSTSTSSRSSPKRISVAASDQSDDKYKEAEEKIGKCPLCNAYLTYTRRIRSTGTQITWPADQLSGCREFRNMSPGDRGALLEKVKGCIKCLCWKHQVQDCDRKRDQKCQEQGESGPCEKEHHGLIHGTEVAYCLAAGIESKAPGGPSLQLIQTVSQKRDGLLSLYCFGSNPEFSM